jgi:methylmalonyl-CoA mutase C-terminal domain/subunit
VDLKKPERIPRVLVAKMGLDGHSRGAYVVAHGLRQAGMEVIYTGIRQTPASVARIAIQEDVDMIGISSMVGAHLSIVKKLRGELEALNASDIPVIIGGIIPDEDYDPLLSLGAKRIFAPGAEVREIVECIRSVNEGPAEIPEGPVWIPEVPGSLTGIEINQLRLSGTKCKKCGQIYFPLRRNCPRCPDGTVEDLPLSEKGILQSFVVADVAPPGYEVPHAQGFIDLFEVGPRIFSLLTDHGNGTELRIGSEMGLKIIKRGSDEENRIVVGYRFTPLQHLDNEET